MAISWVGQNIDVNTEIPCFTNPRLRADLLVTTPVGNNQHYDIIELKAWRSTTQFFDSFCKKSVADDIFKVQASLNFPGAHYTAVRWAVGLVPVAGIKRLYSSQHPAWTDALALEFVEHYFPQVKAGDVLVDLTHTLATNGPSSLIISWWHS